MSIATALTALADDVSAAKAAITAKGGTAPSGTADMADAIAAIPSGGITPSGSVTLTEEDTYDVTDKAQAIVDFSATRADLAEAVTAKGVDTLPTASFDTIATNIGLIEGGGGGFFDEFKKIEYIPASSGGFTVTHNIGQVPTEIYAIAMDGGSISSNNIRLAIKAVGMSRIYPSSNQFADSDWLTSITDSTITFRQYSTNTWVVGKRIAIFLR